MTDEMYADLMATAEALLKLCQEFPAHALNEAHKQRGFGHPNPGSNVPSRMWAVQCEAQD